MTKQELLKVAKPILFNTEIVRAILDGHKTHTMRIIKDKFYYHLQDGSKELPYVKKYIEEFIDSNSKYKKGDIIYVRETFCLGKKFGSNIGQWWSIDTDLKEKVFYKADVIDTNFSDEDNLVKWKPSIHMPKEYARILLKVTNVRVERLQDMHWGDMIAEGVQNEPEWIKLWNSTAPDRYKWEDNPYVFVYSFERIVNVK